MYTKWHAKVHTLLSFWSSSRNTTRFFPILPYNNKVQENTYLKIDIIENINLKNIWNNFKSERYISRFKTAKKSIGQYVILKDDEIRNQKK
jgi:hypothetical protein